MCRAVPGRRRLPGEGEGAGPGRLVGGGGQAGLVPAPRCTLEYTGHELLDGGHHRRERRWSRRRRRGPRSAARCRRRTGRCRSSPTSRAGGSSRVRSRAKSTGAPSRPPAAPAGTIAAVEHRARWSVTASRSIPVSTASPDGPPTPAHVRRRRPRRSRRRGAPPSSTSTGRCWTPSRRSSPTWSGRSPCSTRAPTDSARHCGDADRRRRAGQDADGPVLRRAPAPRPALTGRGLRAGVAGPRRRPRARLRATPFLVSQKIVSISLIWSSRPWATLGSLVFFASPGRLGGLPEQLVQLGVLLEVLGLEVVGPQHPQVVLDQVGPLLLDEDGPLLEHRRRRTR